MSLIPIACMNSRPTYAEPNTAAPLGIDLGGSGPVTASLQPPAAAPTAHAGNYAASSLARMQVAHAGHKDAHGTGTVNSVDAAPHKINLSYQPIPEIAWPAMTMEFPVAPAVDLGAIKPGTRVNFTIEQIEGGMYEIKAMTPVRGGQ
jgi:Cu/Ag efflux protein CusF